MKRKIQIVPSGIPLVDKNWGGFYRGGSYLLMGPRKSGKTLLALQFALECAKQKEVCLFFTSLRPKDLMIHAASIDFDLQYYMNKNLIIVIRVAPPSDYTNDTNKDNFLEEYLNDIVTVVDQHRPNKIIFDELTQFVGFNNLERLHYAFRETTEVIEEANITSLYLIGQPAEPTSQAIVDTVTACVTGIIALENFENEDGDVETEKFHSGLLSIIPNVGHTEGKFSSKYYVEPYVGVVTEKANTINTNSTNMNISNDNRKYTSLADIDLPEENFVSTSFYTENDFKLILNNQIALFKSTGQVFSVISFKLNKNAISKNLISINQLQNIVRLSTDKKDKICIMNDNINVLITRGDKSSINSLLGRIKSNINAKDKTAVLKILNNISVYVLNADENIENANDVFEKLSNDKIQFSNKINF